jgi:competence protein ComGF
LQRAFHQQTRAERTKAKKTAQEKPAETTAEKKNGRYTFREITADLTSHVIGCLFWIFILLSLAEMQDLAHQALSIVLQRWMTFDMGWNMEFLQKHVLKLRQEIIECKRSQGFSEAESSRLHQQLSEELGYYDHHWCSALRTEITGTTPETMLQTIEATVRILPQHILFVFTHMHYSNRMKSMTSARFGNSECKSLKNISGQLHCQGNTLYLISV